MVEMQSLNNFFDFCNNMILLTVPILKLIQSVWPKGTFKKIPYVYLMTISVLIQFPYMYVVLTVLVWFGKLSEFCSQECVRYLQ